MTIYEKLNKIWSICAILLYYFLVEELCSLALNHDELCYENVNISQLMKFQSLL